MTLLVVEDECLILDFICAEMSAIGVPAVGATSADEALRILGSNEAVTGLVSDVNMPGSMDGLKLAHLVRERWPHIGIVITSGRRVLYPHEMPKGAEFLPKPFFPKHIIAAMERVSWAKSGVVFSAPSGPNNR
jgi:CheY-like chemotaxis protein